MKGSSLDTKQKYKRNLINLIHPSISHVTFKLIQIFKINFVPPHFFSFLFFLSSPTAKTTESI